MDINEARCCVETLWLTYYDDVYNQVYRMCRNRHLAEDIAAETFERALRALRRSEETHPTPQPWLRAIAKNLLTDHWRKASRRHEVLVDVCEDAPLLVEEPTVNLADAMAHAKAALATLTPGQREAVVLRSLHELDTAEAARQMGRSPQAVRSLQHKARRKIAEYQAQNDVDLAGLGAEAAGA